MSSGAIAPARLASTILLVRDRPHLQVLMVQRHHQIDFMPGALVFPGGKLDPGDADPGWEQHAIGWRDLSEEERAARIGAARESYEEAGLLLTSNGAAPAAAVAPDLRAAVAKGRERYLDVVADNGLTLDLSAMVPFARWITPTAMPKRFDAFFYLARAPEEQLAERDGWETVDAIWIAPREALRLGAAGERAIVFPTRLNLELLAQSENAKHAIEAARSRRVETILPRVETIDGESFLTIAPDTIHGPARERLDNLKRG